MNFPILFSFRRCPYAIRARLALSHVKLAYIHREVILKAKPQAMLEVSPKGTVPVLLIPQEGALHQSGFKNTDNLQEKCGIVESLNSIESASKFTVVDESLDIMFWALRLGSEESLWGHLDPELQNQSRELIEQNDSSFKYYLDRYKYSDRYPEFPLEYYREKGCEFINKLETRLLKTHYLFGDNVTLADYAIFPFVRQFAHVDKTWFFNESFIGVKKWLLSLLDSAIFQQVMKKYLAWQPEDKPIIIQNNLE